jgi:heat shock protein HtpX
MDNLFSTHPNTNNRIAALEQLALAMGQGDFSGRTPVHRPSGPWNQVRRAGPWG